MNSLNEQGRNGFDDCCSSLMTAGLQMLRASSGLRELEELLPSEELSRKCSTDKVFFVCVRR